MKLPTWWAQIENDQVVDLIIVNGDIDATDFVSRLDGVWVQSPDSGVWAQMGGFYDSVKQKFYAPKPHASWTLDTNNVWQAPKPKPAGNYCWNESTQTWDTILAL